MLLKSITPKESMFTTSKVTQRDIAKACSVHTSTICLALKNSPSIPVETRKRIQLAAEKLGYRPNATAQNLAFMRQDRKGSGTLPIAWINQEDRCDHWRFDPSARVYFEASRRRAAELGYHLEDIWAREPGMSAARLVQILRARGIERVIFPVHGAFDCALLGGDWSDFSTVGLNDHRLGERVDLVCADYYQNAATILRQLERGKGGRIGLALTPQFDAATDGLVHSCLLRYQGQLERSQRVPVCFIDGSPERKARSLRSWVAEYSPDTVISCDPALAALEGVLDDRVRWYRWHDSEDRLALGAGDSSAEVGIAAVEFVIEKSRRFERGLGDATHLHLIKGGCRAQLASQVEFESVVA